MNERKCTGMILAAAMAAGLWGSTVTTQAAQVLPEQREMISPVLDQDGADPFVTRYEDGYLYTRTTGADIRIGIADSLQTLGAAEMKCVYDPGSELRDLWAPEIWQLDGRWYIYFAAVVPGEEMHTMYVLSNESASPMEGEWSCVPLAGMDDKFAIDGTVMELEGQRYFLWSGWEGYENVRQDLYLAQMISPTEVCREKILLSRPELDWELNGNPLINEGPEAIVRGNTVNLVYSASGSWTDDYCLGLLTMEKGKDPKDPDNWTKEEQPVLKRTDDVYGPGHNCFTVSLGGDEDLNIYHAARWMSAGWNRSIRFGFVSFDENGKLLPMEAVSGEELLRLPSGEASVTVFGAELFEVSEEIEICTENGETYLDGFWDSSDTAGLTFEAEEETDAVLTVMVRSLDLFQGMVSGIEVCVNGEAQSKELAGSENYVPLYFPVHLEKGVNEIVIRSDIGGSNLQMKGIELRR